MFLVNISGREYLVTRKQNNQKTKTNKCISIYPNNANTWWIYRRRRNVCIYLVYKNIVIGF